MPIPSPGGSRPPARSPARFPLSLATLTLALAVLALLLASPASALAKDELPRRRLPPEFEYTDAASETRRRPKALPKLLQKYATPKSCAALLDDAPEEAALSLEGPGPDHARLRLRGREDPAVHVDPPLEVRQGEAGRGARSSSTARSASRPPGGGADEAGMFAPAVKPLNLVMVGPSTYEGVEWGSPACRGLVYHALDVLKQNVNVDEDRV